MMQPTLPFGRISIRGSRGASTNPPGQLDEVPRASGDPKHPATPMFVRHPRARRYVVRVRANGTVRVTIPRWGSRREAEAFAASQSAWIQKQLARAAVDEETVREELAPERLRELRARAVRELPSRLLDLAAQHGLTVSRVSIRNQQWRWGSCSPNGHI